MSGTNHTHHHASHADTHLHELGKTSIDPVCGMSVDVATARNVASHQGENAYFCSAHCKEKFLADPQKYAAGKSAAEPLPQGTLYTCPMHPEIVRDAPGTIAAAAMSLSSVSVVGNALRLRAAKL